MIENVALSAIIVYPPQVLEADHDSLGVLSTQPLVERFVPPVLQRPQRSDSDGPKKLAESLLRLEELGNLDCQLYRYIIWRWTL